MNNYEDFISKEQKKFLNSIGVDSLEVYNISKVYSEILLKSKLIEIEGEYKGWFPNTEIEKFVLAFEKFIQIKKIREPNKSMLFELINQTFYEAIDTSSKEQLPHGFYKNKKETNIVGYAGTYIICDHIPDEVVEGIKNKISNDLIV